MIELLVVLAAVSLLLAVAAPRYTQHLNQAREVALRQSLWTLRDVIDKFYADQGRYPVDLQELVTRRYLRAVPVDPVTERADSWTLLAPPAPVAGKVADVRSGAGGKAQDGTPYASW